MGNMKSGELLASEWLPHIWNDPDFREFVEMMDKTLTQKGHDYSGGEAGDMARLRNFYDAANFLGQSPFQTLGTYLYKHITAVFTFLKKGQVESEPIEMRLVDAVNYIGPLLYKMVKRERRANQPKKSMEQLLKDSNGAGEQPVVTR